MAAREDAAHEGAGVAGWAEFRAVTEYTAPKYNDRTKTLVWQLFGSAADEDYLVSRWAGQMGLGYQFYWSAQQAVEKYIKCSLLMNGKSVKRYGHDLLELFQKLECVAGKLLPCIFIPPRCFPLKSCSPHPISEPYMDYMVRLNSLGNANNRYRLYSIVFDRFDVHKLDELCFNLRRLCTPLDVDGRDSMKPLREYLFANPCLQPREFQFTRPSAETLLKAMEILKFRNFSFFPDDAEKEGRVSLTVSAHNAPIDLKLQDPEQHDELRWLLEHAYVNKSDAAVILKQIDANANSKAKND